MIDTTIKETIEKANSEYQVIREKLIEMGVRAGYEARDREVRAALSSITAEIIYNETNGEPKWREHLFQKLVKDVKRILLTHLNSKV